MKLESFLHKVYIGNLPEAATLIKTLIKILKDSNDQLWS